MNKVNHEINLQSRNGKNEFGEKMPKKEIITKS